ncbi:MAG: hypothetical protein AB7G11_10305 [Phycisphaerales bacterium]
MISDWFRAAGVGLCFGLASLTHDALAQAPANSCSSAPLVAVPGVYTGSTVGATPDGTASCGPPGSTPDVWVKFVADRTGIVTVDTCNAAVFDTIVSIRSACQGAELACNDDWCGIASKAAGAVTAGATYWARVSGFSGDIGAFTLTIAYLEPPPCSGDWNHDGFINSQDFFQFITDLFNNQADFNGDATQNSQDLFDFLNALFSGC